MPEFTCLRCGHRGGDDWPAEICLMCALLALAEPAHEGQATPAASSDGAIRAGEPSIQFPRKLPVHCSRCGHGVPRENWNSAWCAACTLAAWTQRMGEVKGDAEAFSEGLPPGRPLSNAAASAKGDASSRPTAAGCLLTFLCVAVIVGSAVPIVTWRDPDFGVPLPRTLSIAAPFLLGGLCYAIGAAILRLLGLALFKKTSGSSGEHAE
jgi:hypothetical protein